METPECSGLNLSPSCLSLCAKMLFEQQLNLVHLDVFGGWKLIFCVAPLAFICLLQNAIIILTLPSLN